MKLHHLRINNFQGINCDLDLGKKRIHYFYGANGVGKTTILDALLWNAIGKLPYRGCNAKNQSQRLATNGTGDIEVSVCYDVDEGMIVRTLDKVVGVMPIELSDPKIAEMLYNPSSILSMSQQARQSIFGSLFKSDKTDEELRKKLSDMMAPADIVKLVLDGKLDEAKKRVVEKRRNYKQQLAIQEDIIKNQPESVIDVDGVKIDLSTMTAAIIHTNIDRVNFKIDELRTIINKYDPAKIEGLVNRKIELSGILTEGAYSEKELHRLQEQYDNLTREVELRNDEYESICDSIRCKEHKIDTWKEDMAAIAQVEGNHCPTCGAQLSSEQRKTRMGILQSNIDKVKNEIISIKPALSVAETNLNETKAEYEECSTNLNNIQRYRPKFLEELARLEVGIENASGFDYDKTKKDFAAYTKSHDSWVRTEVELKKYNSAMNLANRANIEINNLKAAIDGCNAIDDELKPEGSIRSIASGGVSDIQFDEYLVGEWGMESLELTPAGEILLYGRPIEAGSVSEKYRAGVLMAELLSRTMRLGILCIDGIDVLSTKYKLIDRMLEWDFDTIIINEATDNWVTGDNDNIDYWHIKDGEVKK